jgi:glycosyltransferase involved in cell wall biosynthesis
MSAPTAALFYASDGFDTSRAKLMGRHAAGEGFLHGLVRHSGFEPLVAVVPNEREGEAFRRHVAALGGTRRAEAIPEDQLHRLIPIGSFVLPGPGLAGHAWRRRRFGTARDFSLAGVTHTIASTGAMDGILESLIAPVQPWDALVCTSAPVRGAVQRLLEGQAAYLRRRLGAARIEGPMLPVIPLGVDCDALAPDPAERAAWRAKLEIGADDIAVLHHGRLSFHAKAHPLPMFLALGRAAERLPAGRRMVLILSGWFSDDVQRRAFREQAQAVAPALQIRLVERPETGTTVRNAADVFTLLSENIQESFGLAPVEALAAGLPVVGTDWDGLKDTILHGVTGFRVPTTIAGPMPDLAARHETGADSYDGYIAAVAQFTAVDIPAATEAFAALAADDTLRARMAAAARKDALARYDWSVVIAQWRALWDELAKLRRGARTERAQPLRGEERVPHRPDPSVLFADYPTHRLAPETRLALPPGTTAEACFARMQTLLAVAGTAPRREFLPGEAIRAMLAALDAGPARVATLVAEFPAARAWRAQRALAWLLKMDLLRIEPG